MISTRTHGILDYVVGALLILAPFILNFNRGGAETWVPVILGVGVICYSLITRYELSVAKIIPMPTHLMLDAAGGVLLLASPWLFGFADYVMWPHVIVGLLEIGAAAMTERQPGAHTTMAHG
jgi:hypothetical protein